MNRQLRIFSTKCLQPLLVAEVEALGWQLQQQDFIRIARLPVSLNSYIERAASWIFTSQHAVRASAEVLRPVSKWKQIFCLEGATRATLQELLPEASVEATAADGANLAELIIKAAPGSAIFFCGNIRRDEIPQRLKAAAIQTFELCVYETHLVPGKLPKDQDAILFFSPSAVNCFFQNNLIPVNTIYFAIGETTASAIRSNDAKAIVVTARQPKQRSLLDAMKTYYQTQSFESA